MKSNKIAAVLVTFNRLDLLKPLISSLKNQTLKPDAIIVVNNSSTDGTEEWLSKQQDIITIKQKNLGSSGGQYTSMKTAYTMDYDWIWVMDDDVEPELNCLEVLMENPNENEVKSALRYTPENKPFLSEIIKVNMSNPFKSIWSKIISDDDIKNKETCVQGLTFEGPLFHRNVIEKIGYPENKFFIYGDDTEYSIRAIKAGFTLKMVSSAKLNRKLEAPDLNLEFSWKHYYMIRNLIAIDVLNGSSMVRWIRPWGYLLRWLMRCNSLENIKTVLNAFKDGYFYKSDN